MESDDITRIEPESLNETNDIEAHVFANEARRQALLIAKFDNLGKGASGAAVQNLLLMLIRAVIGRRIRAVVPLVSQLCAYLRRYVFAQRESGDCRSLRRPGAARWGSRQREQLRRFGIATSKSLRSCGERAFRNMILRFWKTTATPRDTAFRLSRRLSSSTTPQRR
jgi:hypothetical protein